MVSLRVCCAALIVIMGQASVGSAPGLAQAASPDVASAIMSDSAPGWVPTETQKQNAIRAAGDFFSKLDAGRYDSAYGMMSDANRRYMSAEQFARDNQEFRSRSGPLQQRKFLKITWGKDPASAPVRGIYAAVDVASKYANVDRHCGYVVLYQKSADDGFEVMRQESNFIDNAMAGKIETQKSRAELDRMWAQLAVNCPNYSNNLPNKG
jgi:hypothetical protein